VKRREFIALLGGSAAGWPLGVLAQPATMPVIGFLGGATASGWAPYVSAFRDGLKEAGFDEGRNVTVEYRFAENQYDRLPAMVADLVHRQVAVIVATSTPSALAAKAAATTIPVVFETLSDPVRIGLVASLSRPGGNVTGVTQLNMEIGPKLLELMHEVAPAAKDIALLINPKNPNADGMSKNLQAAARTLGVNLHVLNGGTQGDIDAAIATAVQLRVGGLVLGGDPVINTLSAHIAALALRHKLPTIYQSRVFAEAGGLMTYGGNAMETHRQAGLYAGRILKGEKPADLPIVQAAKVELVINMKTAKALGIAVPLTLLGRADEVIE
jgi:putative ABC transport system substrate-binding protein